MHRNFCGLVSACELPVSSRNMICFSVLRGGNQRAQRNYLPKRIEHCGVPPSLVAQMHDILLSIDQNPEGRQALTKIPITRFVTADSRTYDPARDFLEWFLATLFDPEQSP